MTIATGVAKAVAYKAESTWGTAPGATGAAYLRRVSCDLDQSKGINESQEIRTDYQIADYRHSVKTAKGTLKGELSPGSYSDFIAAALRRAFTAVTPIAALSITIAAGVSPAYTLTRGSGSFLTDGVKIGNVVRLTAGTFNTANLNTNLFVVALTATVATVLVVNGGTLVAEGPITGATLTLPGKKTYVPITGHTDPSFAIEQRFADIGQYELFVGNKVSTIALQMPATGMIGIDIGFMGQQRYQGGSSPYFTTPTAAGATGVLASSSGVLVVNGAPVAVVTGLNVSYDGGMTSPQGVVGSNLIPDIFEGRVKISGDFSAYFQDGDFRDAFDAESACTLALALSTGSTGTADFIALSLPNIKLGGASKDDGEKGLTQKVPFMALYNSAGGAGTATEQSTIAVQDSQAA